MTFSGAGEVQRRAIQYGRAAFADAWTPSQWSIAPGRLELLGNHVDYNGGPVLAAAIDRAVAAGISPTGEPGALALVAGDVDPASWRIDIDTIGDWHASEDHGGPVSYARGIVAALSARGIPIRDGLQLSVAGNVPLGFGMSSSAALCVALVLALTVEAPEPTEIVKIAQEAEHRAGAPVGAMDQSASVAGGIIIFDGATITYEQITPDLGDYVFAVADSGVEHQNATSSYPTRVRESQEALAILQRELNPDLTSLAAISDAEWETIQRSSDSWLNDVLMRRVRHVVTEVRRVRAGIAAVHRGDWDTFGHLMIDSGRSSAGDYEISHPLVEELVADLIVMPGVLGARMMGGGEGGPALALLRRDQADAVSAALAEGYFARHPGHASAGERFQVCVFGDGAHLETATAS
ncbi:MAG: galactokinase family protein [Thermomicrobiales bacterium]